MMSSSRTILAFAVTSCVAACAGASTPRATTTHAATPRVWHFSSSATPDFRTNRHEIAAEPPSLYVHLDQVSDPARKLPDRGGERMADSIRRALATNELSTAWPGELPKSSELALHGSRAFVVAATVHEVKIDTAGRRAMIACRVGIRVAPWYGVDGGEKWEGTNTATAMGSARVSTSTGATEQGVHDCVTEVATSVVTNRIVPFLRDRK